MRRNKPCPATRCVTGYGRIDGRQVARHRHRLQHRRRHHRTGEHAQAGAPDRHRAAGRDADRAAAATPTAGGCPTSWAGGSPACRWTSRPSSRPAPGQYTVPRAAAVLGPSYGDSALHASTAHFVVMTQTPALALSGPTVVDKAIGEDVDHAGLGGPQQAQRGRQRASGGRASEDDAFEAHRGVPVLPARALAAAGAAGPGRGAGARPGADRRRCAERVASRLRHARGRSAASSTRYSVLPWGDDWGPSVLTSLARLDGAPVGVVASQPIVGAGALDPAALHKERAVRRAVRHVQPAARVPAGRAGPADRHRGRTRRHPARATRTSPRRSPAPGCRRWPWCSARPMAAATSPSAAGRPTRTSCSRGRVRR